MSSNGKKVLVSGASFAGLSTAHWLSRLGYQVTVVEIARGVREGGTAVDIKGDTVDIVRRMGLLDRIRAQRLSLKRWDMKNELDVTERSLVLRGEGEPPSDDEFEIERTVLVNMLLDSVKDRVELVFGDSITGLAESKDRIEATFARGSTRSFDLVLGCDGIHSVVRKIWFGAEAEYVHFLKQYFSITIVDELLIERDTGQMYNEPGRAVMLNAYKNKTDIVFAFACDDEIPYDYRDQEQQRRIVAEQFTGRGCGRRSYSQKCGVRGASTSTSCARSGCPRGRKAESRWSAMPAIPRRQPPEWAGRWRSTGRLRWRTRCNDGTETSSSPFVTTTSSFARSSTRSKRRSSG